MQYDAIGSECSPVYFYGDRICPGLSRERIAGSREQQSQADEPERSSHCTLAASRIARRMFTRSDDFNGGTGRYRQSVTVC